MKQTVLVVTEQRAPRETRQAGDAFRRAVNAWLARQLCP